ncbi:PAS domain-containing sensor histidine kinase [Natrarchaeobaculum sulfurireducens]|uniref:histidine kinase n=1 Tax=Natrarchaeobaculum sulfurireducens TaxID=2044521 RepID=A0A346PBR1_9EURY|nr:PAS domain-containing sensor histidine kinase [Natrarchaeobaculum sulfurireducens]AXR76956.1 Signal transduction histidine kinase, contains PAS domain [Natrarchaeobaculum sulfurireducens]AXR80623.1 Signal-transducing histidine kinase-like [Natrarchaeobaculum sulfurireducens]
MSSETGDRLSPDASAAQVFARIDDPVVALDGNWTFTFVNQQAAALFGQDGDELLGECGWGPLEDLFGPSIRDDLQRAMETQESRRIETDTAALDARVRFRAYPAPDGITLCLRDVTADPVPDSSEDDGHSSAIDGTADGDAIIDADEKQVLEDISQRLSIALEAADAGAWEWDVQSDEVVWHESMERLLGSEPGTFEGTYDAFLKRIHPADRDEVETAMAKALERAEDLKLEFRFRDECGDVVWSETKARLFTDEDGTPRRVVGVNIDVADRRTSEGAAERAREELRQVIDLVPDLIFAKNREGEYLLANETTANAYGLSPHEVEGRLEAEVLPEASQHEAFQKDDLAVIDSGEPIEIQAEELITADGETRLLRTTKIPYEVIGTDEDAVLAYSRDITDLDRYERRLEAQRDDLTVINQIVRHDVRNDLQLVLAYAEALTDHVDESGAAYVDQIRNAAHEAVDITATARDMTDVLLRAEATPVPIELRSVLGDRIEHARSSHQNALILTDGPIDDVRVLADDMLESVFRNLFQNAIVHSDTAVPEVRVSTTVTDDRARITIADDGPGVSDARKAEIFEEGIQGLESGGTGIGLYLVRTLVDKYGGDVWVENSDLGGAAFVVELPRAP